MVIDFVLWLLIVLQQFVTMSDIMYLCVLQDIKVNCLAVINDTVGALMSCAHSDNSCAIGLILGKLI